MCDPDGEGSVLDHMMILYSSGMGDGNVHGHDPTSALLAGGALGQIRGGRHIQPAKGTPIAKPARSLARHGGDCWRQDRRHHGQARGLAVPAASRRRGK
jgi:hypothetical protein